MTTKEALEIWKQHGTTKSACYLADAYLAEHDDTPLTLELAKEVLGEPTSGLLALRNDNYSWIIAGKRLEWLDHNERVLCNGIVAETIGQLRTLARLLRGGV